MRRAAALAIAALLLVPPEAPAATSVADPTIGPFRQRAAMRHLHRIVGFGPRPAGSPSYLEASRYVRRRLDRLGFRTKVQRFPLPQGGRSRNVVAWFAGRGRAKVLLGAHLDTVAGSPGANDNASGVAVLLALARAAAEASPAPRVRIVAFGAEERQPNGDHHLGSKAYTRRMPAQHRNALRVMVSVDMIGKAVPLTVGWTESRNDAVVEVLEAAAVAGVQADDLEVGDISDHVPFERAGMAGALLWSGFEPNHHQPTDVVSNVQPRALRRSGRLLAELLGSV